MAPREQAEAAAPKEGDDVVSTDYLVIGSGPSGLALVDERSDVGCAGPSAGAPLRREIVEGSLREAGAELQLIAT